MNSTQYLVSIVRNKSKYDWGCSGKELVDIVNCLNKLTNNCTWFGADFDSNGNNVTLEKWMSPIPHEIGSSNDLIGLAKTTDQFLSGVFLLLPTGKQPLGDEFYTYNYYYRDLKDIILEIRAFDTEDYLLFSENKFLLDHISSAFNSPVKTKSEYELEIGYKEPEDN